MTARPPGRPAHEPTSQLREQVKTMAGLGVPDYDIAKVVGVSQPTLRKHYAEELDVGHIVANAKVAQTLFRTATDPTHPKSAVAAMFWLKCRAGWREQDTQVGKKEQTQTAAVGAHAGTEWESLLAPSAGAVQ